MNNILKFLNTVGILKRLKRAGWVKFNVNTPESVADHSYRGAMTTMVLAKQLGLDELKAIKMALIHDLGEALVGDIITEVGGKEVSSKALKSKKEKKAIDKIFSLLENGDEFIELWDELERKNTKEACLVKEIDKLEMVVQAKEYEKDGDLINNSAEFLISGEKYIDNELLKKIISLLKTNIYKRNKL